MPRNTFGACLCGILAGLGWLSHQGVVFGLFGIVTLVIATLKGTRWPHLLGAIAGFAIITAPWVVYQKLCATPGDSISPSALSPTDPTISRETIDVAYRNIGWKQVLQRKFEEIEITLKGEYTLVWDLTLPKAGARRADQFYRVFLTFWHYMIGWLLLPWVLWKAGKTDAGAYGFLLLCLAWGALTYLNWILAMPNGGLAEITQSSYTMHLVWFLALFSTLRLWSRSLFYIFFVFQICTFSVTWLPASTQVHGPLLTAAVASLILIGLLVSYYFYTITRTGQSETAEDGPALRFQSEVVAS